MRYPIWKLDWQRLKTYLEVKEEAAYGHGALARTINLWGPKLREWLESIHRKSR